MQMKDNSISIIVAATRQDQIYECLTSLIGQDHPKYNILLICSGFIPNDSLKSAIKSTPKMSSILYIKEKMPASVLWNKGLALVNKADIVAFVDDDAVVNPRWLSNINSFFMKSKDYCALNGRILPKKSNAATSNIRQAFYDYRDKASATVGKAELLPWLSMTNCALRLECINKHGLYFDESMKLCAGHELAQRMKRMDLKIGYLANNVVYHNHGRKLEALIKSKKLSGYYYAKIDSAYGVKVPKRLQTIVSYAKHSLTMSALNYKEKLFDMFLSGVLATHYCIYRINSEY